MQIARMIVSLLTWHACTGLAAESQGSSPLSQAIERSDEKNALELISQGAIHHRSNSAPSPFFLAGFWGQPRVMRALLHAEKDNLAQFVKEEAEALFAPAQSSHFNDEVADILLSPEYAFNLETRDATGETPLFAAVRSANRKYSARLLKRGAQVNQRNTRGKRPLHATIEAAPIGRSGIPFSEYLETLQLLLNSGADINAADAEGNTPLHEAYAHFGRRGTGRTAADMTRLVETLLNHGADSAARNQAGKRPAELGDVKIDPAKASLPNERDLKHLAKKYAKDYPGFIFDKSKGVLVDRVRFASVAAFYRLVQRTAHRDRYVIGNHQFQFGFREIRVDDQTVYNELPLIAELEGENQQELATEGDGATLNSVSMSYYQPLSLVGSLLTWEEGFDCACAGGPPSGGTVWRSMDARTGKPPEPTEFFDAHSLVQALKNDSCIKSGIGSEKLSKVVSLNELSKELKESANPDCTGEITFSNIAIADFNPGKDLATVRFGFTSPIGPDHWKVSYFGVHVKPTPQFRSDLLAVSEGKGFLMKKARLRLPAPN